MSLLVTGFTPFGNFKQNPSEILINQIADDFEEINTLILPVSYERSFKTLAETVKLIRPTKIILTGLAQARFDISLEKVALNYSSCPLADNDGVVINNKTINPNGSKAHFTNFDIMNLCASTNGAIKLNQSLTAGSFVCNHLYFRALEAFSSSAKIIFVHLPLTTQVDESAKYTQQQLYESFKGLLKII